MAPSQDSVPRVASFLGVQYIDGANRSKTRSVPARSPGCDWPLADRRPQPRVSSGATNSTAVGQARIEPTAGRQRPFSSPGHPAQSGAIQRAAASDSASVAQALVEQEAAEQLTRDEDISLR